MDLLTIGAFARESRLSPKALRLYDELGLLRPAHVDPVSGYRFYAPEQLEQARLVAWLRRLGMPLATIRTVCALQPAAAAAQIRAFWATVEAETALRRDLADAVVDHLCRGTPAGPAAPVDLRYAVLTDAGLVRPGNQDAVHARDGLLAVADGFGEHGGPASRAVIDSLMPVVADARTSPGDVLNLLHDAVLAANDAVAAAGPPGAGGSTLTALVQTDRDLVLVHIGDSRAYVLRDGELLQVTHDHTYVQALVDEGRLEPDEARSHPRRALLLRALDGRSRPVADVHRVDARPGDRWLLCSDGLSTVLSEDVIHRTTAAAPSPEAAVTALVAGVREAGAPDNVSCVVADVVALQ
jgi:serine/threonine protein phosphatase PrpC/DNA-binding transcriptional MerR regulator